MRSEEQVGIRSSVWGGGNGLPGPRKCCMGSIQGSPRLLPGLDGAILGSVEGLVRLEPLTCYLGMFANLLLGNMDVIVYLGGF